MNKQELIDELARHASCLEDFRGITGHCDGKYEAYEIAIELAKQLDEPQKPVVPRFVAEFVDWTTKRNWAPSDAIREFQNNTPDTINLPDTLELDKLSEYFEIAYCRYDFERACILGYKLEEPLYHVEIPIVNDTYYLIQNKTMSGETYTHLSVVKKNKHSRTWKNSFTEREIKEINADLWAFTVPVEEAAEG